MARKTLQERDEKMLTLRVPNSWWDTLYDYARKKETSVSAEIRSWLKEKALAEGIALSAE